MGPRTIRDIMTPKITNNGWTWNCLHTRGRLERFDLGRSQKRDQRGCFGRGFPPQNGRGGCEPGPGIHPLCRCGLAADKKLAKEGVHHCGPFHRGACGPQGGRRVHKWAEGPCCHRFGGPKERRFLCLGPALSPECPTAPHLGYLGDQTARFYHTVLPV